MKNKMIFYSVLFVFFPVVAAEKSPMKAFILNKSEPNNDFKSTVKLLNRDDVKSEYTKTHGRMDTEKVVIHCKKNDIPVTVGFFRKELVDELEGYKKANQTEDYFFEIPFDGENIIFPLSAKHVSDILDENKVEAKFWFVQNKK